MLERLGLIVGAWEWIGGENNRRGSRLPNVRTRLISDSADRRFLGRVKTRRSSNLPILRQFSRESWDVFEAEDESLLLTVVCPWGWIKPWEMFDADGNIVCILHQHSLFDSGGKVCARLVFEKSKNAYCFTGADGANLGRVRALAQEVELTFGDAIDPDPFAKMALLGAALSLQFPPQTR